MYEMAGGRKFGFLILSINQNNWWEVFFLGGGEGWGGEEGGI